MRCRSIGRSGARIVVVAGLALLIMSLPNCLIAVNYERSARSVGERFSGDLTQRYVRDDDHNRALEFGWGAVALGATGAALAILGLVLERSKRGRANTSTR